SRGAAGAEEARRGFLQAAEAQGGLSARRDLPSPCAGEGRAVPAVRPEYGSGRPAALLLASGVQERIASVGLWIVVLPAAAAPLCSRGDGIDGRDRRPDQADAGPELGAQPPADREQRQSAHRCHHGYLFRARYRLGRVGEGASRGQGSQTGGKRSPENHLDRHRVRRQGGSRRPRAQAGLARGLFCRAEAGAMFNIDDTTRRLLVQNTELPRQRIENSGRARLDAILDICAKPDIVWAVWSNGQAVVKGEKLVAEG